MAKRQIKNNPSIPSVSPKRGSGVKIKFPLYIKLMTGITVLLCLVMSAIFIVVGHQMRQSILDEFLKRGTSIVTNLSAVNTNYVTTYNYVKIEQSISHTYDKNDLLYATVLFFDGEPAAYSGSENIKNQVLGGLIHQRAMDCQDTLIQYSTINGTEFCDIAAPITMNNEKWGTVRVGFPLNHMLLTIADTKKMLIILGTMAIIFGCFAAFLLSRKITRPIANLVKSVELVSQGDYEHPIQVSTRDEIGYLGNRFGAMKQTVKSHVNLLKQTNRELKTSNQKLQKEIYERKQVEKALRLRDEILKAVSYAVETFLINPNFEKNINAILGRLGTAIGAERLFILRERRNGDEDLKSRIRFEWIDEKVSVNKDNIEDYHEDRPAFQQIPIFVDKKEWSYLCFEGLNPEPSLRLASLDAIRTVAHNLGAAIQRKQTMIRLKEANRAKDDFLANMSHELRTPLNHIIGFTELVVDNVYGEVNEKQEEYLNYSLQSSKHLLSLINDILDLSKVESGKMELESSTIDIRYLLENCLNLLKEKALNHDISIQRDIQVDDIITADERKLKQILFNLLFNAVKFTPDGGTVKLKAEMVNCLVRPGRRQGDMVSSFVVEPISGPIGHNNDNIGRCLKISVIDNGIGIKGENLERIFQRFDQVESSMDRNYEGSGLGLSLAKSFVELHGGKIWAESDGLDKGSTFSFIVPPVSEDDRSIESTNNSINHVA